MWKVLPWLNFLAMIVMLFWAALYRDWTLAATALSAVCGWGARLAYAYDHP